MSTALNLEISGSGPPLLLLHGAAPGATGHNNFGGNVEVLAQNFQVLLADLPGSGKSEILQFQGKDPYAELADLFAGELERKGIDEVHVVGMATGAGIGIAMAARHPKLVNKLVAVGPPGGRSSWHPEPSEGSKAMNSYFLNGGPSREKMRAYLELTVAKPQTISESILESRFVESQRKWEKIQAGEVPSKASAAKLLGHASSVATKTLIVWGLQNRLQAAANLIDFLQAIPSAEAHIYKDAGLWVPFEKQSEFNSLVENFLNEP